MKSKEIVATNIDVICGSYPSHLIILFTWHTWSFCLSSCITGTSLTSSETVEGSNGIFATETLGEGDDM